MSTPDRDEARALLARASGVDAATRAGASWPAVAYLLMLGPASALGLIGYWVADGEPLLTSLVMGVQMFWVLGGIVFLIRFQRLTKRGFGVRWLVTMGLWGALWGVGMAGIHGFGDSLGFVAAVAVALSLVCFVGAWLEASR